MSQYWMAPLPALQVKVTTALAKRDPWGGLVIVAGVLFTKTVRALALTLATTRSGLSSPFRSATARENGPAPVLRSVLGVKAPFPIPSKTETVLALKFATTRSGFPSPFTSLMTTARGPAPVTKSFCDHRVRV